MKIRTRIMGIEIRTQRRTETPSRFFLFSFSRASESIESEESLSTSNEEARLFFFSLLLLGSLVFFFLAQDGTRRNSPSPVPTACCLLQVFEIITRREITYNQERVPSPC